MGALGYPVISFTSGDPSNKFGQNQILPIWDKADREYFKCSEISYSRGKMLCYVCMYVVRMNIPLEHSRPATFCDLLLHCATFWPNTKANWDQNVFTITIKQQLYWITSCPCKQVIASQNPPHDNGISEISKGHSKTSHSFCRLDDLRSLWQIAISQCQLMTGAL